MPSPRQAVPGYAALPALSRLRVHALAALQAALDRSALGAASVFDAAPAPLRRRLKSLAAPLRIARPSAPARLHIEQLRGELSHARFLTRPDQPRVSIVVPTRGGTWLALCLAAVAAYSEAGYELIVVDDGSPNPELVMQALEPHPGVIRVRNEASAGFPAAVNRGVRRAAAERVVVLNDDAVVTPGWLTGLERALSSSPDVALVGPCSNDTGDVATVVARYDSLAGLLAWAKQSVGAPREVHKLSLFCALVRRSAFEAVGGLDEGYGSGMFEDDELCMALAARGLRVLLVPSVFVHHAAGATLRRLSPFEYHARFEVNRRRFEQRWGVRWRPS